MRIVYTMPVACLLLALGLGMANNAEEGNFSEQTTVTGQKDGCKWRFDTPEVNRFAALVLSQQEEIRRLQAQNDRLLGIVERLAGQPCQPKQKTNKVIDLHSWSDATLAPAVIRGIPAQVYENPRNVQD